MCVHSVENMLLFPLGSHQLWQMFIRRRGFLCIKTSAAIKDAENDSEDDSITYCDL